MMGVADRSLGMKSIPKLTDTPRFSRPVLARKTPIQRAIFLRLADSGDASRSISGTLFANDFGDGATTHRVEGYLTDCGGVERRVYGRLDGVKFISTETRGAPKKTGRDVALHLAYLWFLGRAKRNAIARPENTAREEVMQLWIGKGFRGVSEETHLRKHLRTGKRAAHGLDLLRFEAFDTGLGGAVIAAPAAAFVCEQRRISIDGRGWFWSHGMETAVYGKLSVDVPRDTDHGG